MPNQEILRNRLESGLKQGDGIVASGFIKSPSLGPGRYALEKYNSRNNFVTDAGKLSRLARDGSSNIHNDNCQLGNKSEAAFGLSTPIKNLNIGNGQGLGGQLGHDKQTSIMNGINQEIQKPNRQGQAASQSANALKVLGDRPTGKLISTVIEDPVALPHKNSLNSPVCVPDYVVYSCFEVICGNDKLCVGDLNVCHMFFAENRCKERHCNRNQIQLYPVHH